MKFGKLMAGAILAVSAVAANAADYETTQVINLVAAEDFGNNYGLQNSKNKTFLDTYTFSILANSDLDSSLTSFTTKPKFDLDITSFNLFKGATLVSQGTEVSDGQLDAWTLSSLNLVAGEYSLQIGGTFLGNSGGSYGGDINVAVSPVPEPATWGMLGLGLAAVGFAARRKQAK